jgi:phosphoenolpyruvate carboxylase
LAKIVCLTAKTPFFKREKPTPYDEAQFLLEYLENVFYDSVGQLQDRLSKVIGDKFTDYHKFFTLGFWPGGDRDGNPFVRVRFKKLWSYDFKDIIRTN